MVCSNKTEWVCELKDMSLNAFEQKTIFLLPQPTQNVWKIVNATVSTPDLPSPMLVGKKGRVEIADETFLCALVGVEVSNAHMRGESIGKPGHHYIQGETIVEIEFLILEDRWPKVEQGHLVFSWEDGC